MSRDRTAFYTLKKALYDTAVTLWADDHPEFVQFWGVPPNPPMEYGQWLGGDGEQQPATLSTNRSRDETVRVEAEFFCLKPGEENSARDAEEYIFDRVGELERHVRVTNPTLGGIALHCFLRNTVADTRALREPNFIGHIAGVLVVFEGRVRITG